MLMLFLCYPSHKSVFVRNIYIYIYIVEKTDNVLSRLLPIRQWPYGNSCAWTHDVRLYIAGTNEPKSTQQVKQGA